MSTLETRIRVAAAFIGAGLTVELVTLRWAHPTAFVIFTVVGGVLLAAGFLAYLSTLLWPDGQG